MKVRLGLLVGAAGVVSMVLASCGGTDEPISEVAGVSAAPGVGVELVADGLVGPTQFVVVDDETFIVATINGGENDRQGQIVRVDTAQDRVEVLREGLDKPTGVALVGDELWVMERDRLTRGPLGGPATVVADQLPNNGRSQGTLTVTPDGMILFDTSGSKRGAVVTEGSGRLFTVDPDDAAGQPVEVANGFKHAYAHTYDHDGVLWSTEMSDGRFDGERAADELVRVAIGADHGWPRCVGDNRPVVEFGGDDASCSSPPSSTALFAPGATPTSVAVSPFEADSLLVALWVEGRVVSVDAGGTDPTGFDDVITGLSGPQHLVAVGDVVYLSEHGTGRLLRVTT